MKVFSILIVLALATTGCASQRANPPVCGDHGSVLAHTTHSVTTILLKPRPNTPSLYLIADHYLILMRPDEVISFLEARVAEEFHARDDERPLAAIKARLPITDDMDLMRFSFNDTRVFSRPGYVAAALLEAGSASVVDLWDTGEGRTLQDIVAMRLEGGGIWRDFCEPTGQSILFVTDEIAD